MGRKKRGARARKPVRERQRVPVELLAVASTPKPLPDMGPIVGRLTPEQRVEFGRDLEERFAPQADRLLALPVPFLLLAGPEAIREALKVLPLLESVELPAGGKAEALRDRLRLLADRVT